jgi:hypothetical protein
MQYCYYMIYGVLLCQYVNNDRMHRCVLHMPAAVKVNSREAVLLLQILELGGLPKPYISFVVQTIPWAYLYELLLAYQELIQSYFTLSDM